MTRPYLTDDAKKRQCHMDYLNTQQSRLENGTNSVW